MRARGITLIEVVLSAGLLLVISLVIMSSFRPVQETTRNSVVSVDMDEDAARVLRAIRRELRQSGHDATGDDMILEPAPGRSRETPAAPAPAAVVDLLRFRRRIDLDRWTSEITLRATPDGVLRGTTLALYRLERVDANGTAIPQVTSLTAAAVERDPDTSLFRVHIELTRADPNGQGVVTRVYDEVVRPLNPDPTQ